MRHNNCKWCGQKILYPKNYCNIICKERHELFIKTTDEMLNMDNSKQPKEENNE